MKVGDYITVKGTRARYTNGKGVTTEQMTKPVLESIVRSMSFEQFAAAEKNSPVNVHGIVAGVHKKGYIITNEAGVALYVYENAPASVKIGDEVAVSGQKSSYNKCYQVGSPKTTVLASGKTAVQTEAVEATDALLDGWKSDSFSKLITVTGTASGDYGNVTFGSKEYTVSPYQTESSVYDAKAADGKNVTLTGYVVQNYNGKSFRILVTKAEVK